MLRCWQACWNPIWGWAGKETNTMKTVLLGVSGGIAAYKAAEIVRALQKRGYDVRVMMTANAAQFVSPLTFAALSHHEALTDEFDCPGNPIPHITLGQGCDLFLIAPATANVVAKMAAGIADDLLTSTVLACTAPVMVAPAMNVHMYEKTVTQDNLATLRRRGIAVIDAASGYQACGDLGPGRLPEPEQIADVVDEHFQREAAPLPWTGRKVLITAGPTVEPIDAVRFVSNYSSGKMGYALAEAALSRGAEVTLVSGPVSLPAPMGATVVPVKTARDMLAACEEAFDSADVFIASAAVADFRPAETAKEKLKKGTEGQEGLEHVRFVENPDILATMGARKRPGQIVVGFAAETSDIERYGRQKLASKHADMIVANQVGEGNGFGTDDNQALLITESGSEALPLMAKTRLADAILDKIEQI